VAVCWHRYLLCHHWSAALAVQKFGDAELQAMLGGVATGEVVLTAAFHEEHTYDAYTPNIQVSGGKLNGKKLCVPYANIATRMLVIAKDENAKDGKDVALFIVDPKDASVKLTAHESHHIRATVYC
jgi:alkylation response protein AidB-like acyl-CoA dehydrogenase